MSDTSIQTLLSASSHLITKTTFREKSCNCSHFPDGEPEVHSKKHRERELAWTSSESKAPGLTQIVCPISLHGGQRSWCQGCWSSSQGVVLWAVAPAVKGSAGNLSPPPHSSCLRVYSAFLILPTSFSIIISLSELGPFLNKRFDAPLLLSVEVRWGLRLPSESSGR